MHPTQPAEAWWAALAWGQRAALTGARNGPAGSRSIRLARALRGFTIGSAGRSLRLPVLSPSKAVDPPFVVFPHTRVDRIRQNYGDVLVGVVANHFEGPNGSVQIVPPLFL